VKDITVMVLERDRHKKLIEDIRKCDARIMLIPDGDISAAIAPSIPNSGVDILMGIGAAPEGVLAATALSCLGGYMEGKFAFRNDEEKKRAKEMGVKKLDSVMKIKDLVDTDNAIFAATGVTDGPFLRGVRFTKEGAITHSIVTRSKSKTLRFIEGYHVYNEVKK
jgi:fructose-1,6-bisphosphatase II